MLLTRLFFFLAVISAASFASNHLVIYSPPAERLPSRTLVVFLHANMAGSHLLYNSFLKSIADAGHHAAFINYQTVGGNSAGDAQEYEARIVEAMVEAVERTRPKRLVLSGHSSGGYLAQYIASHLTEYQKEFVALRTPLAAMVLLEASSIYSSKFPGYLGGNYPLPDLKGINASTLFVSVVAETSGVTNCENEKAEYQSLWDIDWKAMQRFPRKNFLMIPNQSHGVEKIVSNHFDPLSLPVNQFDQFGYQRITLSAIACATNGSRCEEALGTSPLTLNLGSFKDGAPLSPMVPPSELFKAGGRATCTALRTLGK